MANANKFKEEEAEGYRVDIIGRNIQVTEPIRDYVWDKLAKIERFHNHIMHLHMTLEIQKLEHVCTIVLKVDHTEVKAKREAPTCMLPSTRRSSACTCCWPATKAAFKIIIRKSSPRSTCRSMSFHRPYNEVDEINAAIEEVNAKKQMESFARLK